MAPVVERVRPGVWSIPVIIPNNPLGWTLVYLIESDRGPVLVDTGWHDPLAWDGLVEGIAAAGHDVTTTYGVLVTHHHPDHHGLSGNVQEASGAWIAMHEADAEVVTRARDTDHGWILQTAAVLLAAGAGEDVFEQLPDPDILAASKPPRPALPNRLIGDGQLADVPGWDVRSVWTPGHTPGHVCFVMEQDRLLLSGDHLLPEITPHIGLYREDDSADPLGDYLRSLERLEALDIDEVLPAHQHRFHGHRARARAIAEHHAVRFDAIRHTLRDGPATAWTITAAMPWNRAWDEIHPMMKRAALSEALAHVRHMEREGTVQQLPGSNPLTYQLVAAA